MNPEGDYVINTSKPRVIKRFKKPPPLKMSNNSQPSPGTRTSTPSSSMFEDKINESTPRVEVTRSKNDENYKKNLFKSESKTAEGLLKNNLSSTQNKYESSSGENSNTPARSAIATSEKMSLIMYRLKMLDVVHKSNVEKSNSQNNQSSTNKIEGNGSSSGLNNKLPNKRKFSIEDKSSEMDESQDKNQMWSLSSTIWSSGALVKSKEISCALSLQGTLILTNMYSGSLCSTKEYSKPTLLKTLNLDNNWELPNEILSSDELSAEELSPDKKSIAETVKFLQSNANFTAAFRNGLSSEKKNNLFKASQAQQQRDESQYAQQSSSQSMKNSTSDPVKKSRNSMLLERLRSEAHKEHSPPPSTSSASGASSSNSSPSSSGSRPGASCYNCGHDGHKYFKCPRPVTRNFCHRCGWEDVSSDACPFCTGTLVRPGSHRPVPVGGDAQKKYASVDLDQTREKYMMTKKPRQGKSR